MSSDFHDFMTSGFQEAAAQFSPTDEPQVIRFGDKTATVVGGALMSAEEMKNAGVQPEFDETAVVLLSEFELLGAQIESEIQIGGRTLEIKTVSYASPFVTLGLKATV